MRPAIAGDACPVKLRSAEASRVHGDNCRASSSRHLLHPDSLRAARSTIEGGAPLRGEVTIGGAKNAALPVLAATLLTARRVRPHQRPRSRRYPHDGRTCCDRSAPTIEFDRAGIASASAQPRSPAPPPRPSSSPRCAPRSWSPARSWPRSARCRASTPGGCQLGARPVDVDVRGFRQMGAEIEASPNSRSPHAPTVLRGARIYMDYPSHTGTENLLMAAALADGTHDDRQRLPASRRSSRSATCSTGWARGSAGSARRRSSSTASIACTASPKRSCRTGSRPAPTPSARSSPAAR